MAGLRRDGWGMIGFVHDRRSWGFRAHGYELFGLG
jgi:hypothetical protein